MTSGPFVSSQLLFTANPMVQELNRAQQQPVDFPDHAPTAYPVFYRTYSRRMDGERESWQQTTDRTLRGLVKLGNLSDQEASLLDRMQKRIVALPSGRWLWVGGTDWLENPQNFSGAYNCTSTNVIDWKAFGLMMDLAMMGCGTGGVLEPRYIEQLPPVRNSITVTVTGELGTVPVGQRLQETTVDIVGNAVRVVVGDSRQGWVKSYQTLLICAAMSALMAKCKWRSTSATCGRLGKRSGASVVWLTRSSCRNSTIG